MTFEGRHGCRVCQTFEEKILESNGWRRFKIPGFMFGYVIHRWNDHNEGHY